MKATEFQIFFTDSNTMIFIIVVAVVFSIAMVIMMFNDYRFFMDNHRRQKFSIVDFCRREQFCVYLLLVFLVLIGVELWKQMQA